jgi:hypothetical protein
VILAGLGRGRARAPAPPRVEPRSGRHPLLAAAAALALLAGAAALHPDGAGAQTCSTGRGGGGSCSLSGLAITLTVGRATHLSVSPSTTPLTPPTTSHYNSGYAATDGPTVTVRSNSPWSVAISGATATWGAVVTGLEPARTDKPASDLRWSTTPLGTFAALSTTPTTVSTGGSATTGSSFTLYYRTDYSFALDTPGAYSLQVVFTLTAP